MVTTDSFCSQIAHILLIQRQTLIVIVRGGRAGYPAWRDNNDSSDSQDPPQVST